MRSMTPPVGSSPRVRGTEIHMVAKAFRRRFIPACAGNRTLNAPGAVEVTVHPRVCGEQVVAVAGWSSDAGSSPRVRGTESVTSYYRSAGRFIPACAGNRNRLCG